MHHCRSLRQQSNRPTSNIERLFCLHQAIYPDKYLDGTQDLVPFLHESRKGHWKSSDAWIKDYWNSGFAVPGTTQPQGDLKDIRRQLTKYLVETYDWAANGRPPNLKNWPRDLRGSWALFGPSAIPVSQPTVHVSAITTEQGRAKLVHRELTFAPSDASEEAGPTIQDVAVKSDEVLELADKINKALPAGALVDLTEKDKPTYQITWNAHVKVRK